MNERLVWIDCEMTGLDLGADALIEVAALVTDFDLNVLGDGIDLVIKPPAEAPRPDERLRAHMHETSGLLDELATASRWPRPRSRCSPTSSALPRRRAGRRWPATPSPPTARSWPATCRRSRRSCTTGSSTSPRSRSSPRRWFPRAYFQAPRKRGNHRALADIQESIEELRYYREAVFVPPPGPDSDAVKVARSPAGTVAR